MRQLVADVPETTFLAVFYLARKRRGDQRISTGVDRCRYPFRYYIIIINIIIPIISSDCEAGRRLVCPLERASGCLSSFRRGAQQ